MTDPRTAYRIYMAIIDCPGITPFKLARLFGRKFASFVENKLPFIESNYGLLSEDENGGLYLFQEINA